MQLNVLAPILAICRLAPSDQIPAWGLQGNLISVTRTPEELSIVCCEADVPESVQRVDCGWRCLKVEGPFDLATAGVLDSIVGPLTDANISVFVISTFDTDYILVNQEQLEAAIAALRDAGHEVVGHC